MWTVPSRARPHNLVRLVDACLRAGLTTPGVVLVDDDDPLFDAYRSIVLPPGWSLAEGPPGPLSLIYNRWFAANPGEPWYGFLADDVVPETGGFDRALVIAAGNDGMAVPAGGETTGGSPHFVIAGSLARETGWLSLPGLSRLYIDTVWADIARARGTLRFRPEITLAHHHFSNGLALFDRTYRKAASNRDRDIYTAWKGTL